MFQKNIPLNYHLFSEFGVLFHCFMSTLILFYYLSNVGHFECCRVQEFFVRKANPKKGMFASTHLVLRDPDGSKYEAAKKWNLPAVTMAWLLQCARTGKKADETQYLVDNTSVDGWWLFTLTLTVS